MERFNVIKDYCVVNGLTQIKNSWIQTAGNHLGVAQEIDDNYEQRVFVAVIGTSDNTIVSRIESPDGLSYVDTFNGAVDIHTDGEFLFEADSNLAIIGDGNVTLGNYGGDAQLFINDTNDFVTLKSPSAVILKGGEINIGGDSLGSFNVYTNLFLSTTTEDINITSGRHTIFYVNGNFYINNGPAGTANIVLDITMFPTDSTGLSDGTIYTQTSTELGGSGTTKVLCIK